MPRFAPVCTQASPHQASACANGLGACPTDLLIGRYACCAVRVVLYDQWMLAAVHTVPPRGLRSIAALD